MDANELLKLAPLECRIHLKRFDSLRRELSDPVICKKCEPCHSIGVVLEKLDAGFREVVRHPLAAVQLGVLTVFVLSALLLLFSHQPSQTGDAVRTPHLVMGMSVIALALSFNKGAMAATLTVLIVGVLVAPSNYLLRIAHMISRADSPFEQYAKRYAGEDTAAITPEELVNGVMKRLEARGIHVQEPVKQAITQAVSNEALEALAKRIRTFETPLEWVIDGPNSIRERANRYSMLPDFQRDMRALRDEGVIDFPDSDYGKAVPTELGKRVAALLNAPRSLAPELKTEPTPSPSAPKT